MGNPAGAASSQENKQYVMLKNTQVPPIRVVIWLFAALMTAQPITPGKL